MAQLGLDYDKLRSRQKPDRMLDGENVIDKYQLGFDLTGNEPWYDKWTGKFLQYLVKEGDTLETLANKYNIKPHEIALLNRKKGNMISDQVNEGQLIIIPLIDNNMVD